MLSNLCSLSLAGKQVTPGFTDLRNTQVRSLAKCVGQEFMLRFGGPSGSESLKAAALARPSWTGPLPAPSEAWAELRPPCAAAGGLPSWLPAGWRPASAPRQWPAGSGHALAGRGLVWKEMSPALLP